MAAQQEQHTITIVKQAQQANALCTYYFVYADTTPDSTINNNTVYKIQNSQCGVPLGSMMYLCQNKIKSQGQHISIQECQFTSDRIGLITTLCGAVYGAFWIAIYTMCYCLKCCIIRRSAQTQGTIPQSTPVVTDSVPKDLVAFVPSPLDIPNMHVAKGEGSNDGLAIVIHPGSHEIPGAAK